MKLAVSLRHTVTATERETQPGYLQGLEWLARRVGLQRAPVKTRTCSMNCKLVAFELCDPLQSSTHTLQFVPCYCELFMDRDVHVLQAQLCCYELNPSTNVTLPHKLLFCQVLITSGYRPLRGSFRVAFTTHPVHLILIFLPHRFLSSGLISWGLPTQILHSFIPSLSSPEH